MSDIFFDSIDTEFDTTDGSTTDSSSSGGMDGFQEITEPTPTPPEQTQETPATPEPTIAPTDGEIQITPEPLPEATASTPTPEPDHTQEPETEYNMDDLYKLLDEWMIAQDEQRKTDTEALTQAATSYLEAQTEYRNYMQDQARNIFSVNVLILLSLAFVSGILLARVVWRKM